MHGNRDEHPEVFKARMQFHKDNKKQSNQGAQPTRGAPSHLQPKQKQQGSSDAGAKVPDKDASQDKAQTEKRRASFQHKAKAQHDAEAKKPAKGVLTHLLPNQ